MCNFSSVLPSGQNVYTPFTLSAEELELVEERLRPGCYSEAGFLDGKESLMEVCTRDLTTLMKLEITCEQIRDHLLGIVKKAEQIAKASTKFETQVRVGNRFEVSGIGMATNGYQECPFHRSDLLCHKGRRNYTVTNLKSKESFTFSDLAIELIGKHAFFEGNSPYRVDPEKACRVLELKPGNYPKIIEKSWEWCEGGEIEMGAEEAAKKYAAKVCVIDQFATAYLDLPYTDFEKYENRGLTQIEAIRKKQKMDRSDEELIASERGLITNWNPNSPEFIDEGKKYCHVFNRQDRKERVPFSIEGTPVKVALEFENCFIFERIEESYAEIHLV